jgi:hypothetical protein
VLATGMMYLGSEDTKHKTWIRWRCEAKKKPPVRSWRVLIGEGVTGKQFRLHVEAVS